jgi:phosphoenolpyruvate carboxykinase (GTP)
VPTTGAIAPPAEVSPDDLRELLAVDLAGWRRELADIEANHYPTFKDRLPAELAAELSALKLRLEQASMG